MVRPSNVPHSRPRSYRQPTWMATKNAAASIEQLGPADAPTLTEPFRPAVPPQCVSNSIALPPGHGDTDGHGSTATTMAGGETGGDVLSQDQRQAMRGRWLGKAKWAGVGVCLVAGLGWTWSVFWEFMYVSQVPIPGASNTYGVCNLSVQRGSLNYSYDEFVISQVPPRVGRWWNVRELPDRWDDEPPWVVWWPSFVPRGAAGYSCELPLWMVVLPNAFLWLLDLRCFKRKRARGHCFCGYCLAGNTSGRCPECGEPVPWSRGSI